MLDLKDTGNRVVIPTIMTPATLNCLHTPRTRRSHFNALTCKTHYLFSGQNYRMISQIWFTSVMNAKEWQQEAQTPRETDLSNMSHGHPGHGFGWLSRSTCLSDNWLFLWLSHLKHPREWDNSSCHNSAEQLHIFGKFGLPEKVISDNGPCFSSNNFRLFWDQLDIGHITSSPHYHQSNGRAERAVSTIEQILKKSASNILTSPKLWQLTMALLWVTLNHHLLSFSIIGESTPVSAWLWHQRNWSAEVSS